MERTSRVVHFITIWVDNESIIFGPNHIYMVFKSEIQRSIYVLSPLLFSRTYVYRYVHGVVNSVVGLASPRLDAPVCLINEQCSKWNINGAQTYNIHSSRQTFSRWVGIRQRYIYIAQLWVVAGSRDMVYLQPQGRFKVETRRMDQIFAIYILSNLITKFSEFFFFYPVYPSAIFFFFLSK